MDSIESHTRSHGIRATVSGIVQGVGFRPYVYRLALDCGLTGSVRNTGQGVLLELFGERASEFLNRLPKEAPPLVLITDIAVEECNADTPTDFRILQSDGGVAKTALIPADVALCDDCRRELLDPHDRRYRYPFINCTNCGPRYTITAAIPYDRPQTSMRVFPMCTLCLEEYENPTDRRFHAQPNACPECGPWLQYRTAEDASGMHIGDAAFTAAVRLLRAGGILAVRGLGGYHLAVDAANDTAIMELRKRKRRFEKPLAVMFRDLDEAARHCIISPVEARALKASQHPIVILSRRQGHGIAPAVSLDNPTIGVMLPYTPLHVLLTEELPALVMSSANISEEPICIAVAEAEARLANIADGFLHHNRDILQRCDDSVLRVINSETQLVRRARGYVPRPVLLRDAGPAVLAVGAELKNTLCLASSRAAIVSQHIGDLENLEAIHFFEEALVHLLRVFDIAPAAIAHDLHPHYLGSQWARQPFTPQLREQFAGLPRIAVQHHHAHFASCLAENGHSGRAIGVILDGTGYGTDGESWGGEFLLGDVREFQRKAHFHPLPMPGGDTAVREPWRMAWSAMIEAGLHPERDFAAFSQRRSESERQAVHYALATQTNTPTTTGCGRLFDAVASLIGIADTVTFEAQAAIALEHAAGRSSREAYGFDVVESETSGMPNQLSFLPAIREIVQDVHNGESIAVMSRRFHNTVIHGCATMVRMLAEVNNCSTVVLSGGVFQNGLLLEGLVEILRNASLTVLTHHQVPANDGGISLGQAVITRTLLQG
ncbi:MAG: carbamoyltransferase HypF [Bacteroidia bacterium]|nr:carbamoyltransferase HypF [Bacteroidia bacterium]